MVAVPRSAELSDITALVLNGWSAQELADASIEAFDVLYDEGSRSGTVFGVAVHPFLFGTPSRARQLERLLSHVASRSDVWIATTDQIADRALRSVPTPSPERVDALSRRPVPLGADAAPPLRVSPVIKRPPLEFPGGARLAVYVLVNVEYFEPGKPALSLYAGTASFPVDPLNYGWRDYGPRVGIWRMFDLFDGSGSRRARRSTPTSARSTRRSSRRVAERNWAWIAHGKNNSTMQGGMQEAEEREYLRDVVATIEAATGARPQGWLGPSLTETENTPPLLRELGLSYVLDWGNDDQPYPLTTEGMVAVPYPSELHDIPMLVSYGWTGTEFADALIEQFDVLYEEGGRRTGSVFGLGLHPFLVGQPFRIRHLERVLAHIAAHDDVWLATSDEIAAHYRSTLDGGR